MQIPGGELSESCVLDGIMLNKDIVHPKMRRRIENPRIVLYARYHLMNFSLHRLSIIYFVMAQVGL
jgi:hypothetical protein